MRMRPAPGLIEPEQEPRDRGLAGARRPDDGDRVARGRIERNAAQDRSAGIIGELGVLNRTAPALTFKGCAPGKSSISGFWARMANIASTSMIACLMSR